MPLETGSFIGDLTATNPTSSDPVGQGDDHLRLIKTCLQGSMPNMGSVIGQVRQQDVTGSISSSWNTNHLVVTSSATTLVTLTLPPAASVTSGFFVDITTLDAANVLVLAGTGGSISSAASYAIPEQSTARLFYQGTNQWRSIMHPNNSALSIVQANLRVNGTMSVSGVATIGDLLTLTAGQIAFPATQNPSAGANTLDDYEEGTFTPTFTFATPGNLAVSYTARVGQYTKIGNVVSVEINLSFGVTHTTASGNASITGLPFSANGSVPMALYLSGVQTGGVDAAPCAFTSGTTLVVARYLGSTGVTSINGLGSYPSGSSFISLYATTYRV